MEVTIKDGVVTSFSGTVTEYISVLSTLDNTDTPCPKEDDCDCSDDDDWIPEDTISIGDMVTHEAFGDEPMIVVGTRSVGDLREDLLEFAEYELEDRLDADYVVMGLQDGVWIFAEESELSLI